MPRLWKTLLDHLEADDLPARQAGGVAVLVPHAQRQRGCVEERLGLLPVLDLGARSVVLHGVQERALVAQAPKRVANHERLHTITGVTVTCQSLTGSSTGHTSWVPKP